MIDKLEIGSGHYGLGGDYVTLDKYEPADICADMSNIPLADCVVVGHIHCEHTLEHLTHRGAYVALIEMYRILAPGACLKLIVPDLDWTMRQFLDEENYDKKWGLWHSRLFGSQIHEGEYHKTGFTLDRITGLVIKAKFEIEEAAVAWNPRHNQPDIQITARKPKPLFRGVRSSP